MGKSNKISSGGVHSKKIPMIAAITSKIPSCQLICWCVELQPSKDSSIHIPQNFTMVSLQGCGASSKTTDRKTPSLQQQSALLGQGHLFKVLMVSIPLVKTLSGNDCSAGCDVVLSSNWSPHPPADNRFALKLGGWSVADGQEYALW
ncbi:hypothetical protein IHK62_005118 [Escherichia coli]|nr:hypothetical protein [Escherichia coli]